MNFKESALHGNILKMLELLSDFFIEMLSMLSWFFSIFFYLYTYGGPKELKSGQFYFYRPKYIAFHIPHKSGLKSKNKGQWRWREILYRRRFEGYDSYYYEYYRNEEEYNNEEI